MKRRREKWDIRAFQYNPAKAIVEQLQVNPPQKDAAMIICEAIEHNEYLSFDYRHRGIIAHVTGHVHYYNENNQSLHIVDISGKARYLRTEDVVHMEIYKEW